MNVKYKIVKSNRKTISLAINKEGVVIISAPKNTSEEYLKSLLIKKNKWITKHINKITHSNEKYADVISGKQSLVLGKIVPKITKKEFETTAKSYLTAKTIEISNKIGLKCNKISFKNYKSRWGCCNKNKEITLNYKLFMLDENTICYVIVHELCHTIYMNHKREFNNLVHRFIKNVKPYKDNLKEVGALLKI